MRRGKTAEILTKYVEFQYRKRYEVTCDAMSDDPEDEEDREFQYRKRYEVTCDPWKAEPLAPTKGVSIPQAV